MNVKQFVNLQAFYPTVLTVPNIFRKFSIYFHPQLTHGVDHSWRYFILISQVQSLCVTLPDPLYSGLVSTVFKIRFNFSCFRFIKIVALLYRNSETTF